MNSGTIDSDEGAYIDSFRENITAMLSLFISKSLEDAVKYIEICKRDGVTKKDLELALKYQARKFFNNTNLENELEELKQEMEQELADEEAYADYVERSEEDGDGDGDEEGDGDGGEEGGSEEGGSEEGGSEEGEDSESEGEWEDVEPGQVSLPAKIPITSDNPLDDVLGCMSVDDENVQPFKRAELREIAVHDRNFVKDIHQNFDTWEEWSPANDMEKAIFNAIETMTAKF